MQNGIITDGDGPYQPGVDDCTWTIAPPGADRLFLTLSKLSLGGISGNDDEELEIVACESIACVFPQNIPRSPFSQRSPTIRWLFPLSQPWQHTNIFYNRSLFVRANFQVHHCSANFNINLFTCKSLVFLELLKMIYKKNNERYSQVIALLKR